jgi:hypothetical protein
MGKPTLLVAGHLAGEAGRAHPDAVPIDYIIGQIRRKMPEFGGAPPRGLPDCVYILRSDTGSGKSTVLPARLFRLLRSEKSAAALRLGGPGVVCAQPRILTAQTLARDLAADAANYPDLVMGVTVGYQTGPLNEKPAHGLIYATAGSLLAELRLRPDSDIMAQYRFIVVDEAHERSLDTDALLLRLKTFLRRNLGNPRLPIVVLASATLPLAKYAAYFGLAGAPANVFRVAGRTFPIRTFWPRVGTNNYPDQAARLVVEIHERNPEDPPAEADILVFLPGGAEIAAVAALLAGANRRFRAATSAAAPFLLLAINRQVVQEGGRDYVLLKESPSRLAVPALDGATFLRPARRVILSTVVAETGLTLETLKYVVDCGWSREKESYFPGRLAGLLTRPAPKSRIAQRRGRVGRLFPGQFFPLYTENVHRSLPVEQLPQIVVGGVAPIFLDVLAATVAANGGGPFRVEQIDLLDPPPADALAAALEEGLAFGYLRPAADEDGRVAGHALTRLGQIAGRCPRLPMHLLQTLLAGFLWRVAIRDLVLIVSLFGERAVPLYLTKAEAEAEGQGPAEPRRAALRAGLPPHLREGAFPALRARLLLSDDYIEALLAFEGFARALEDSQGDLGGLLAWCAENGISFERAAGLAAKRDAIIDEVIAAGLNPFWGEEYRLAAAPPEAFFDAAVRLKHCIAAGLRFRRLCIQPGSSPTTYRSAAGWAAGAPFLYSRKEFEDLASLGVGRSALSALRRPRSFVSDEIRLALPPGGRGGPPPLLFMVRAGLVSVLDGYVATDETLLAPRSAGGWGEEEAGARAPAARAASGGNRHDGDFRAPAARAAGGGNRHGGDFRAPAARATGGGKRRENGPPGGKIGPYGQVRAYSRISAVRAGAPPLPIALLPAKLRREYHRLLGGQIGLAGD